MSAPSLATLQARARTARQAAQAATDLGTAEYAAGWIAKARAAEAAYQAAKQAHMAAIRRRNADTMPSAAGRRIPLGSAWDI